MLGDPGPSADELNSILTAAARVPDHKKIVPWRFVVFQGDARRSFGEQLATVLQREETEQPSEVRLQAECDRFMRAPVVIAVINCLNRDRGVPEIEQVLSSGAACFNLCLAANALGYGTSWITEWYAFSKGAGAILQLKENEQIAGFIYVGTASEKQVDRDRPALGDIVQHWDS